MRIFAVDINYRGVTRASRVYLIQHAHIGDLTQEVCPKVVKALPKALKRNLNSFGEFLPVES